MKHRITKLMILAALTMLIGISAVITPSGSASTKALNLILDLNAEVIATGIPGAGAIAQVGTFHKGGPFNDNPAFKAFTQPGQVLDRTRLFVASTSNFGAPLARPNEAAGSILSLDISGSVIAIPETFAAGGGQASALDGRVMLYAAQSAAFLNGINNPNAVTRSLPSVSLPLGISSNNGFGRPWFANSPSGSAGAGTITVIDPSGVPLAGAPSTVAGGVFAGNVTNRDPESSQGLPAGALATALITKSPDLSGRAVFLAALADGSVAQVHVQRGVDSLAPPASFTPIPGINVEAAESPRPDVITRVGMVFNWVPTREVFVTDPLANRLLVLDLTDDGVIFRANRRYLTSPLLDKPIDVAPAVPEVAARNFASNTTLGGGSDLYVLNRGNNTIVRMTQTGEVIEARQIQAPVTGFRVNGLAVSEDARTIWVTATAPGRQGVVLQMPTFGAGDVTPSLIEHAMSAGANGAVAQGADMFAQELQSQQGLGPLFNGRSCASCHNTPNAGGMGVLPETFIMRVARIVDGAFDPLTGHGGPVARQRSITEFGISCGLPIGIPPLANATSMRSAMTLRGVSLIDNLQLNDILAVQSAQPLAVRGRLNRLADGRCGRFGWKAQTATLVEFMAEALRDEIGLTNPLAPLDLVEGCGTSLFKAEADAVALTSLVAFLNTLDPPAPSETCLSSRGAALFAAVGCAVCHTPSLPGPGGQVRLYSDLLLHDMGLGLADGFEQNSAKGREFRTAPLWRVSERQHFLHDGRARTIADAILQHGSGQATSAVRAFLGLSLTDQQAILDFLRCI